ncbi:MAG TPA: tetratricopeptide repeat protein [Terriglobia bacterium]|nr:tetratricopeptide repeat protein [Terriglobia bacterium]
MSWKKYVWTVAVLLLSVSANLIAVQVNVKITDHQGQVVEAAETRLVSVQPGVDVVAISSKTGEVQFDVASGAYKLMIRKAGFLPVVSRELTVGDAPVSVEPKLITQTVLDKLTKDAEEAVKKKKHKEAAELYKQVLTYFPQDGGFWANLAAAYRMDNDMDRAMAAIEQASKYDAQFQTLEKEIVGTAAYEAGKKQLSQREFPKAVDSFGKSVKADPTYAPAFYGLALSYANQGMYPQALENIQKAVELSPNDAQYKDIHERLKKAMASSRK